MITGRLLRAAHARLDRIRSGAGGDGGFALVFVLMVTTVITIAVATTLITTSNNIRDGQNDANAQAAYAAAESGLEDYLGYLSSQVNCTSTTRVCDEALGVHSWAGTTASYTSISGTNEKFEWYTDSTKTTGDHNVRVHSVGVSGTITRKLVADVALAKSILSYGYYTDYESQDQKFLTSYYAGRKIYVPTSSDYNQINAYNTKGAQTKVTAPTTVTWAQATSGSYAPSICGQHWYADTDPTTGATRPGRASYGTQSIWNENATFDTTTDTVPRYASCDVVFTTGMTFDGPVYTRDAMLISDKTVGGTGPTFKKPVLTRWGYNLGDGVCCNNPVPTTNQAWRLDPNVGGSLAATSQKPTTATYDLQLPNNIVKTNLPTNTCVYYGPTRIKLNGDGTATITSPYTTKANSTSSSSCYPSGSLAGGIYQFNLNYQSIGNGAIYVQHSLATNGTSTDTAPATWPSNGRTGTSANSIFSYTSTAGAGTGIDQTNGSAANDSCTSSVKYSANASAACSWSNVATATDTSGGATGWSAYTSATKCNVATTASDRQLFECEYSHTTSATLPPGTGYGLLRAAVKTDIASCTTASCLTSTLNTDLKTANTGQHAANYALAASGDHQYVVTATTTNSSATGTTRTVGAAPAAPLASDTMFTSTTGTAASETSTTTPVTLNVGRQTYDCYNTASPFAKYTGVGACTGSRAMSWGDGANSGAATAQFTVTPTITTWAFTPATAGKSIFPSTLDVTKYNGSVTGTYGTDYPGDLYVEGTNKGQLSLLAQNDIVVTNDVLDASSNQKQDAVDLIADGDVRNFHPVQCLDQTSGDVTKTDANWCPNDLTGLYASVAAVENNGVLTCVHPASQYVNMTPVVTTANASASSCGSTTSNRLACTDPSTLPGREIDAAIFALTGSFYTDNYSRSCPLGNLTVDGGLYQSHRGANGVQWEYQSGDATRATSGYSLQYHYIDLQHSNLPYTPPVTSSGVRTYKIVSVSTESGS